MATVVEFVGLPGAGKSTLAAALAADLRRGGIDATEPTARVAERPRPRRVLDKARWSLIGLRHAPVESLAAARTVGRSDQPTVGDLARVLLNLQFVRGVLLEAERAAGVVVLDQGLYQALWSVALASARPAAAIDELARLARPTPDLVVVVAADPATVAARLNARDWPRSRFDPGRDLDRAVAALDRVASLADGRTATVAVENESHDDLADAVATLTTAIDAHRRV